MYIFEFANFTDVHTDSRVLTIRMKFQKLFCEVYDISVVEVDR